MTNDKFNDSLSSLLEEGRINYVLSHLREKCNSALGAHPDLENLVRQIDRISETYSHLRHYLIEGKPDPSRASLYESIKDDIRNLARRYLFILNEDRLDPIFAEYRLQKIRKISVAELAADISKADFRIGMSNETDVDPSPFIKKREELADRLFRKIWSLIPGEKEELSEVARLLEDNQTPFDIRSQIISALLLSLLKINDPQKFLLLLDAYNSFTDERLAARALTAIVLVLSRWGYSAAADARVRGTLEMIADSILTYTRIKEVMMTLIRTHDTDRVSREVKEAFDTTMREISPEMLEKLQQEGMSTDASETGMNPEWEKLMKNKDLEEKMQNINDMQLEGMDVMMQTFARLKHFSFFRSVANWFLPFSRSHSSVSPLFETFDERGFTAMADATDMCGGDRFSFVLGILQMPEDKRNMLAANVSASLEALSDHLKDRENVKRKSDFASEALSFARDLYRFAKLFPDRKNFFDPFESPIDFLQLPVLSSLLAENEIILTSADFYFEHGYYSLALPLYEDAMITGAADRKGFEKIGYCYQMESNYTKALENYEKADLFSSDADQSSVWLLKKLAFCNKAAGNYERAAEYYSRVLERDPEDRNAEFHLGNLLLRIGQTESGIEHLSKLMYHDPAHRGYARAYVRALIMRAKDGNYEEAYQAAMKRLPEATEPADFRLKANAAFLTGRLEEAATLYALAARDEEDSGFMKRVIAELDFLAPGFDSTTLRILLDRER